MSSTSIILLVVAGVLFVCGIIFLFYSGNTEKKKTGGYDEGYGLLYQELYLKEGDIRTVLDDLLDYYQDNKFMERLVEKAIAYADGDYGDYETTLHILNINDDVAIRKIHEESINLEIAKKMGLPGENPES